MIFGISGKKSHGKDTVVNIIQYLTSDCSDRYSFDEYLKYRHQEGKYYSEWENKKFASKLKQIVALLIGCNPIDLENEDFKSKPLGREWNKYKTPEGYISQFQYDTLGKNQQSLCELVVLNPRLLLQTTGTEFGRDLVHPQIWINSLFTGYRDSKPCSCKEKKKGNPSILDMRCFHCTKKEGSKWIISDMRFKNEFQAVKDRGGITVRINNPRIISTDTHPSETDLDEQEFDYYVNNSGSIDELVEKVKIMLNHYEIKI